MTKILNFIPLLVWMLGAMFLLSLDEHWSRGFGIDKISMEENLKAAALGYLIGCAFWLMLGIILCL